MYYKNFRDLNPEIDINQKMHTKILKTFFSIVVTKMIHSMFKFSFPGLGSFYITKEPPKMIQKEDGTIKVLAPINWPETMKVRKLTGDNTKKVVYLNNHTHSYIYKFKWDKYAVAFVNKAYYSFIAATSVKNELKNALNDSIKPLNAYMP
jgi:hypothetical protein